MVFAGFFPTDPAEYESMRDALSKLHLNDSSFQFEPDTSDALGFGFRCGFLGLLHMEIIQERLEREYDLDLITTAPSVVYHAFTKQGEMVKVDNPSKMPVVGNLERIEEPILKLTVHVPSEYVGPVVALCEARRGRQLGLHYATKDHIVITYELPLAEVILDFHDKLKSASRGYASMDYELTGYRADDLVKLDSGPFFFDYPKNIKLYGLSFNTTVGDYSIQGEVAYRPNLPVQVSVIDVAFAAAQPFLTRCHDLDPTTPGAQTGCAAPRRSPDAEGASMTSWSKRACRLAGFAAAVLLLWPVLAARADDQVNVRFSWKLKGDPHIVFYIEREDALDVVRVLHEARDMPAALAEPDRHQP